MKKISTPTIYLGIIAILIALAPDPAQAEVRKMVEIAVKFWEISDADSLDLGVIWDYNRKDAQDGDLFDSTLNFPGFRRHSTRPFEAVGDVLDVRYGILKATIQAGILENKAHLLANPKITVIDGMKAEFHCGEKIPYNTINYDPEKFNLVTRFIDAGVHLEVIPQIIKGASEYVLLQVRPSVKTMIEYRQDGDTQFPIIAHRSASTTVQVKSGTEFIIGGLIREQEVEVKRKVPLLGSLPILGAVFRSTNRDVQTVELIISLTPTIIDPYAPRTIHATE